MQAVICKNKAPSRVDCIQCSVRSFALGFEPRLATCSKSCQNFICLEVIIALPDQEAVGSNPIVR